MPLPARHQAATRGVREGRFSAPRDALLAHGGRPKQGSPAGNVGSLQFANRAGLRKLRVPLISQPVCESSVLFVVGFDRFDPEMANTIGGDKTPHFVSLENP